MNYNADRKSSLAQKVKSKRLRSFVVSLLGLVIALSFVYYLYITADQYLQLLKLSVPGIILLLVLSMAFPVFNGMQNTLLYRSLGSTHFSHIDGFLIAATSSLANQLPLPGGILSKGYYLKRKYNLSYTLFTSSTLALFFCFVSLDGFIGLIVLLYWAVFKQAAISVYLWTGFTLMAASLAIFWFPLNRMKLPEGIHERFHRALEGWLHISQNPYMVLKIIGLQAVMILFLAARYWLAFRMLSQNITFGQVLLMSNVSILTQMVSLAPGGLGVREALVGGVASVLGFDMAVSVASVGLDRLVSTFMKLVVGGISTVILGRQLADISVNTDGEAIS